MMRLYQCKTSSLLLDRSRGAANPSRSKRLPSAKPSLLQTLGGHPTRVGIENHRQGHAFARLLPSVQRPTSFESIKKVSGMTTTQPQHSAAPPQPERTDMDKCIAEMPASSFLPIDSGFFFHMDSAEDGKAPSTRAADAAWVTVTINLLKRDRRLNKFRQTRAFPSIGLHMLKKYCHRSHVFLS